MSNVLPHVLKSLSQEARTYRDAEPFPHIVIDDFLPEATIDEMIDVFPPPSSKIWNERIDETYQRKLACNQIDESPDPIRSVFYQLNSASVLRALETLTGEGPLISDPFFAGGGLHQIERGSRLAVHADFNLPGHLPMYRRLNLLIYLNRDWDDAFAGHLELWSRDGKQKVKAVAPVANRAVLFTTDTGSYHGHPVPLRCPEGRTRKSLAFYYYSIEPPERLHTGTTTRWRVDADPERHSVKQKAATLLWGLSRKLSHVAQTLEKSKTRRSRRA